MAAASSAGFQVAPSYGRAWISSNGLTQLNQRLGDSVALSQAERHGVAPILGGTAWVADSLFNSFGCLGFHRVNESISASKSLASGGKTSLASQYSLMSVGVGGGFRLFPFDRSKFNPRSAAKAKKQWQKLYVASMLYVDYLSISQSYHLKSPATDSEVEYQLSATHVALTPSLRVAYVANAAVHIFVEWGYGMSSPLSLAVKVSKLTVDGQDQRSRAESAGVDQLGTAPFTIIRAVGGISIRF